MAFLSDLRLQGFQSLVEVLQRVPLPHAAHASRRNLHPPFGQLIGGPQLSPRRLFARNRHDRLFNLWGDPILEIRLAPTQLLQCRFSPLCVQFLKAINTISAVAHDLARLRDVAQLLSQLQQSQLYLDHFLRGLHLVVPFSPLGVRQRRLTTLSDQIVAFTDSDRGKSTALTSIQYSPRPTHPAALLPSTHKKLNSHPRCAAREIITTGGRHVSWPSIGDGWSWKPHERRQRGRSGLSPHRSGLTIPGPPNVLSPPRKYNRTSTQRCT